MAAAAVVAPALVVVMAGIDVDADDRSFDALAAVAEPISYPVRECLL